MRKILDIFEGFPWCFRKDQGKEGQGRLKKVVIHSLLAFFSIFATFFEPGAKRPREPFFDFFGISGPKGPNDSCKGPGRLWR